LIIIGDSWSCGEWATISGKYQIVHKGVEQYCIDHSIPVKNYSFPAAGNFQHLSLFSDRHITNEKVFWFITCPLRGPDPTRDDPGKLAIKKLHSLFEKIDDLSIRHNLQIYLLGGLCDLDSIDIDVSRYNFDIVIPSISKFLDPQYSASSVFGDLGCAQRVIQDKNYAMDVFDAIEKKFDFFKNSTDYPDDGHPGRSAHQKIFQFIKQYV
jgi:hypothetical protein